MEDHSFDTARLQPLVIQWLESWQRAGLGHLPRQLLTAAIEPAALTEAVPAAVEVDSTQTETMPKPKSATKTKKAKSDSTDDRLAALSVIAQEVSQCVRCSHLAEARHSTVPGEGNPAARLVFCGEAPGADEDMQGRPFIGRAGQLLTKIIEACTLTREEVFILNVLKCRPPNNRNPAPGEVSNCREYLDRQLAIIQPEYICCLGTIAAQTLLQTELSIGKLRGKFHDYRGIPVWCTYHPAYLLRNPGAKKDVWEDMKVLMGKMGVKL